MIWDIYRLVSVSVLPKIGKRPDWTGLSSTRTHMSCMIIWSTEFWNFFTSSALAFWPATRNGARFRVPCLVGGPGSENVACSFGGLEASTSEEASSWAPSETVREELTASWNATQLYDLRYGHLTECLRIRARWKFPAAWWPHSGAMQEYERYPSLSMCLIPRHLRRSSSLQPFVLVHCRFRDSINHWIV